MSAHRNQQAGPATALVQLLQEHPELQPANWQISRDGLLMGTVDAFAEYDVRPVIAAYEEILGGFLTESRYESPSHGGSECLSVQLHATWRDVRFSVWASCPASVLNEAPAVAA